MLRVGELSLSNGLLRRGLEPFSKAAFECPPRDAERLYEVVDGKASAGLCTNLSHGFGHQGVGDSLELAGLPQLEPDWFDPLNAMFGRCSSHPAIEHFCGAEADEERVRNDAADGWAAKLA